MNAIDLSPLYRSSIGFDRLASLLDSALSADSSTGYPPYNIELIDENRYAITLAVAGFSQEQLSIQVEKGVLTVRGEQSKKEDHSFLYQGIHAGKFERKFNLAEYVEVTGADLTNGLLTINLVKNIPEAMKPRTINIQSGDSLAIEHQQETKANS